MRARIFVGNVFEFLSSVGVLVLFVHVRNFSRHLGLERGANARLEYSHGVAIAGGSLHRLALGVSSPAKHTQGNHNRQDDDVERELLMRKDDIRAVHEGLAHFVLFQFLAGNMLRQLLLPEEKAYR